MAYRDVVMADAPIAYWRLGDPSGTTADAEVGPDLTYVNTPTLGVPGLLVADSDTAVAFDRPSSEEASIATGNIVGASAGCTMEAWIDMGSAVWANGDLLTIVAWGTQSATVGFHWFFLGGFGTTAFDMNWQYADGTAFRDVFPPVQNTPAAGRHFLSVRHDYAAERVYFGYDTVETVVDVSANGPAVFPPATSRIMLAGYTAGNHHFDGVLDEVAIFDKVLAPDRLLAHYRAGIGADQVSADYSAFPKFPPRREMT